MIFVYIFLGLIVLLFIIAALMPRSYNIEKSIIINKPVREVMDVVGNLNIYSEWNPWQQTEPASQKTITGTPGTPGHKYAWEGRKIGVGSLTLRERDEQHIHFDLEFLKPWKSQASDNWLFEQWGNAETKVTWQNSGQLPWPTARLMGPILSKNLNHQFGIGLENLKKKCES